MTVEEYNKMAIATIDTNNNSIVPYCELDLPVKEKPEPPKSYFTENLAVMETLLRDKMLPEFIKPENFTPEKLKAHSEIWRSEEYCAVLRFNVEEKIHDEIRRIDSVLDNADLKEHGITYNITDERELFWRTKLNRKNIIYVKVRAWLFANTSFRDKLICKGE